MRQQVSKGPPKFFWLWLIIVLLFGAGSIVLIKLSPVNDDILVVAKSFVAPDNWLIPRDVTVEQEGILIFHSGKVKLPPSCVIRIRGTVKWPQSLEKLIFEPASDAQTCELRIEFSGDGRVSDSCFYGFTGPLGDPRLRLAISAKGQLEVENCSMEGVSCAEGSSMLYGEKGIKIRQCRYDGDNRIPNADRKIVATTGEADIYGFELSRLNGFNQLFECRVVRASNLSLFGVRCRSILSEGCNVARFLALSVAESEIERPLLSSQEVFLERSVIACKASAISIASPEIAVVNSFISAKGIFFDSGLAAVSGSILISPNSSIVFGKSGGVKNGIYQSDSDISLKHCLMSMLTPSEGFLRVFSTGGMPMPHEDEIPQAKSYIYGCTMVLTNDSILDVKAVWQKCQLFSGDKLLVVPKGVSKFEAIGTSIPNEVSDNAIDNPALASVVEEIYRRQLFGK